MSSRSDNYVLRFTLSERIQHFLLLGSLLVLALTGLSLMFHDTALGRFMIRLEGGLESRGMIHRISAAVLIVVSLYHHAYVLLSERGHLLLRNYLFHRDDLRRAAQGLKYNLGSGDAAADWGKFNLAQKLQYFGVIFGVCSMILTGLVLWVGTPAIALIPKWLMDLTIIIHGHEGFLIFIILLLWHLYNVHLAPGNFPMNMSWITGRIPIEECKMRYPAEHKRLLETGELRESIPSGGK